MSKIRTITLTNRAPVKIDEANWPCIAEASDHQGEHECQASGEWAVRVRAHADGRRIVYGHYDIGPGGDVAGTPEPRAGYLMAGDAGMIAAIHMVAEGIGHPSIAARVIAGLPAEVLS